MSVGLSSAKRFSLVAESVATFALCFVAMSALCLDTLERGSLGAIGRSLVAAAAAVAMLAGSARRSPGLANPIVAVALLAVGRMTWRQATGLVAAQVAGAALAACLTRGLFPEEVLFLAPLRHFEVNFAQAAAGQFVWAFLMIWALFGTTRMRLCPNGNPRAIWSQPLVTAGVMGLVLFASEVIVLRLTGGAANPARAVAQSLAAWTWTGQMTHWLAPLAGAVLAAVWFNVWYKPR